MTKRGRALSRRYGRAGAKSPMDAFRAAARKIEKQIAWLAAGGSAGAGNLEGRFSEDSSSVFKAINRLDDRASKPEIRGDDAVRDEAYGIVTALRQRARDAEPVGFEASQAARMGEISRIKEAERDRRAEEYARDPAGAQYRHELELLRGKR
jgi:hypothetical protein